MKVSCNWLSDYINLEIPPSKIAELLTGSGLEVASVQEYGSVKGGMEGLVVGEVKEKQQHPNADRLCLTQVDVGNENPLMIVCGAPNVEKGQKVVVAPVGARLHPINGESFEIKAAKIRGEASEGMICAEDEIGIGTDHYGIIVLSEEATVGSPAKKYFDIEQDTVIEIDLTPNRIDGASHYGVARDLAAVLGMATPQLPSVSGFSVENTDLPIEVVLEDTLACPRYSGVTISGVEVKDSPVWLQNRLKAIGLKPINNIVDATNFVLYELGQPLHAFDANEIKGGKVIVKQLPDKTKFITLDEVERELSSDDLMICNTEYGMCIAGVFGGIASGVTEKTKNIFLESACFNPVSIRKTAKRHGLNTDASYRFERGADPNITVFAVKRAAMLIKEVARGTISSEIVDVYPKPVENFNITFSYANCDRLIGMEIERQTIKSILTALEIEIVNETKEGLQLSVPRFRPDVQREADVIEEILRVYGYNNIENPAAVRSSLSYVPKPDREKAQNLVSDLLVSNGFREMMSNSLTNSAYYKNATTWDEGQLVQIINPNSSELNVLRQTLLFSGLEAILYNQNRKNHDLKLFEFGATYNLQKGADKYGEMQHLTMFLSGRKKEESWNASDAQADFYHLKGFVETVLQRLGVSPNSVKELDTYPFAYGLSFVAQEKKLVDFGELMPSVTEQFDIKTQVFFADFSWDNLLALLAQDTISYKEMPKYPEVRRDLALLVSKEVQYAEIEKLAFEVEKNLLKSVNLFDVYEGENIEKGKKSYAVSFIFGHKEKTLTDEAVDAMVQQLIKTYTEKLGATIR